MLAELNWSALLGGGSIGVAVTAVVGWLRAARQMSGKIKTSDAQDLWTEAGKMREDYKGQLDRANERSLSLEIRVAKLEDRNNELTAKNLVLKGEVQTCKDQGRGMRARITELETQLRGAT